MKKLPATLLVFLLGTIFTTSPAFGASIEALYGEINKLPAAQRQKRLEDGARKEGAFKFYGISNAALLGAYTAGFMKRYPFIKAEFWRGSGNKLVFRTLTEHRAGQLDTDAVLVGTENVMTLKRSGIWTRYHSPESANFGKEYTDKDGYWHADSLGVSTLGYNTKLVKKEEAPRGYDDLFDAKWRAALSIDMEPERALMSWLTAWGEQKTRAFVEGLIKHGATVRRGHTLQAQLLCAGEFKVAVEIYPDGLLRMKQGGCPAALVFPNPTPAHISGAIGIYVNTKNPHAAALFVDFMKSAEGAKILAATGRISGRKGVKSLYDELNNLEERGVPLLIVGPEQSELVAKPMERIMKDILVP
ncbi:MAG TPA: extracellular solute-binding protein [Candidatus Limnocylindrales bacterium]|nr:extracellular solute-binding protein [Candidatus Limnocylindrales bacterium]